MYFGKWAILKLRHIEINNCLTAEGTCVNRSVQTRKDYISLNAIELKYRNNYLNISNVRD